MDMIKMKPSSYSELKTLEMTEAMLDETGIENISIEPLLFQTGYLTIKEILPSMGSPVYLLDMPNFEVREAFNLHVLSALTENDGIRVGRMHKMLLEALNSGDLQKMLEIMRGLFASIPYQLHVELEAYYHSIFYAVMSVLGLDIDAEVSVSKGRVDAILELSDKVYIMEFKYKGCAINTSQDVKNKLFESALTEGMNQIHAKSYHKKYVGNGKSICLATFAFLGRDDIELRTEYI
jgi:hypothetical protein